MEAKLCGGYVSNCARRHTAGPDDVPEGAARFPRDLVDAAERFRESGVARRIYGDAFVDHFALVCEVENTSLAREVSSAERKRYLEG